MAASDALVFDAIRTPRGKGKSNGSLHATKPVDLVVGLMHEMLVRNERLDPNRVDDVVLGVSRRSATRAPTSPRPPRSRPVCRTRSPASSSTASAPPASRPSTSPPRRSPPAGGPRPRRWRGVDVPRANGLRRRRLGDGPRDQLRHRLRPAGRRRRPDRHGRGLHPRRRRRLRRALAGARRGRPGRRQVRQLGRPGQGHQRNLVLDNDEFIRPGTTVETLGKLKPSFAADGRDGRLRRRRAAEVPLDREDRPRPPRRATPRGIVDGAALVAIGNEETGNELGLTPRARILATAVSGADPTIMLTGPAPAAQARRWPRPASTGRRHRPRRDQRGVRRGRRCASCSDMDLDLREGQRQRRRDRHGPPARRDRRA